MSNATVTDTSTFTSSTFSADTSTFTSDSSTFTSTSSVEVPVSTSTFVTTAYVTPVTSSEIIYTSIVTQTQSASDGSVGPTIIYITSTATPTLTSSSVYYYSPTPSTTSSSSSTTASALATAAITSSKTKGLSSGGTIAIAVIVPIAAIFLLILALLFLWRKRKARKAAEEQRKKEIEEYGFNPNHDPTLAAGGAVYSENRSEMTEDNSGYRGWGAGSTQRKPSTHLSSGRGGAIGAAVSDSSSNPGGYGYPASPSNGTGAASEGHSGDPLVANEPVGALGGAAAMSRRHSNREIHRGPSNASSAYSTGRAQSQISDDTALPAIGAPGPYYHEEGPYYNDASQQQGPYGDAAYVSDQPVIRDVQARRQTRIEKTPSLPQQSTPGIARNF